MAVAIAGDVALELGGEGAALWTGPDEGHVALHHVDELGQLVGPQPAEHAPHLRAPVRGQVGLGQAQLGRRPRDIGLALGDVGLDHGAELQDRELAPVATDPPLAVEDGPR